MKFSDLKEHDKFISSSGYVYYRESCSIGNAISEEGEWREFEPHCEVELIPQKPKQTP